MEYKPNYRREYYEDDRLIISDELKNMSPEELDELIEKLEAEAKRTREDRRKR